MYLEIDYGVANILRQLVLTEIDSCIASARHARIRAANHNDYRESDIALKYENRARVLIDFLNALDSSMKAYRL